MSAKDERQSDFFNVCKDCTDSCCRNARPPISSKREKTIKAYLKKHKILIEKPFVRVKYLFPREDAEGYCAFYDKASMRCIVHPVKPETCVAGPVTFDINIPNRKIEWFLKKDSICALAGKLRKNEKMFKKHFESAKKEILNLVCALDPEALQAILKIAESETCKIDESDIANKVLDKLKP
jgi:Fe-S-cluster containining protein